MTDNIFKKPNSKTFARPKIQEKTVAYQSITISIRHNAENAGVFNLQIGARNCEVEFYDKLTLDETQSALYDSLQRKLDRYYYVTKSDNSIIIVSVFGEPSEKVTLACGTTGILADVNVVEKNRDIVLPVMDAKAANQVIVIEDEYDFGGDTLEVPADSTLLFRGGSILNARIKYDNTLISGDCDIVNCICEGRLANKEVTPEMFGARTMNFRDNEYDISQAIQSALDNGNYNFVVDNDPGNVYHWYNTVRLYEQVSPDPRSGSGYDPGAHAWNVSIRGKNSEPVLGQGSHYSIYTIIIHCQVAFRCYYTPSTSYPFSFHGTPWPCVFLSGLSFVFQNSLTGTVFFEGVISRSRVDGVNVLNCWRFVHGGITVRTLITRCFVEVCEYAFGGYLVDSNVEDCYFTAYRKSADIEPAFYMNSILYGNSYQIGSLTATVVSGNFINYFYTVYVMGHTWDDCIVSHGNVYNVFKYFAWCKYWVSQVLTDRSDSRGTAVISHGDTFRNCNNFPVSDPKSTDLHLGSQMSASANVRKTFTEGGVTKYEIYSIFGKVMNNSSFQVDSFIDITNSFVFARDKARKTGDTYNADDYSFGTSTVFAFKGDYEEDGKAVHSSEFICGGRPWMYPFKYLSSSTGSVSSSNLRYRRPSLHDLQDMTVTSLPSTQLFNGRRVVFNNEICTFRQSSAVNYAGTWVNPQGVVKGTVS